MSRDPSRNAGRGWLDILEGPCCEDRACPVRELFEFPCETRAEMVARLTDRYGARQEALR